MKKAIAALAAVAALGAVPATASAHARAICGYTGAGMIGTYATGSVSCATAHSVERHWFDYLQYQPRSKARIAGRVWTLFRSHSGYVVWAYTHGGLVEIDLP
jgi:hypothetical protein